MKIHPKVPIYLTRYIKKKKTLCNTLSWGNWNSGFVKLGVWWAEQDINYNSAGCKSCFGGNYSREETIQERKVFPEIWYYFAM